MEFRQLETFVRAVQMGSFTKAAESLGYSQAAVTVQIHMLEQELGVRLFDRMKKRISLTSQGRALLHHANAILREVKQAEEILREGQELSGTLRVGTIASLCYTKLPPILRYFRTVYPKVAVHITTDSPEELIERMEHNDVDLIYILDDALYNNSWYKAMEKRESVVLVASPALRLDTSAPIPLEDLVRLPFFLTEQDANYRLAFDRYLAAHRLSVQPAVESTNTEFLIRLLEENAGVSVLPLYTVRSSLEAGRLHLLPMANMEIVMYRQIFLHKNKWRTREMEEFIRLASADLDSNIQ